MNFDKRQSNKDEDTRDKNNLEYIVVKSCTEESVTNMQNMCKY